MLQVVHYQIYNTPQMPNIFSGESSSLWSVLSLCRGLLLKYHTIIYVVNLFYVSQLCLMCRTQFRFNIQFSYQPKRAKFSPSPLTQLTQLFSISAFIVALMKFLLYILCSIFYMIHETIHSERPPSICTIEQRF